MCIPDIYYSSCGFIPCYGAHIRYHIRAKHRYCTIITTNHLLGVFVLSLVLYFCVLLWRLQLALWICLHTVIGSFSSLSVSVGVDVGVFWAEQC